MIRLILIVAYACILAACTPGRGERVLFDFESEAELNRIHWKCHSLLSLSGQHATHGKQSLKLELYPSDYPGLAPMLEVNDWRPYRAFCFDVYNPQSKAIQVSVRIDDSRDYPDYQDRYNRNYKLEPGMNRISIPLDTLVASGTHRMLDLGKIYRVLIFLSHPKTKVLLYVDYLRLV